MILPIINQPAVKKKVESAVTGNFAKDITPPEVVKANAARNQAAAEQATLPTQPTLIRDQNTGQVSGVTLPNGKTYLGNQRDVNDIIQNYVNTNATPFGAVENNAPLANFAANQLANPTPETQQIISAIQNQKAPSNIGGILAEAGTQAAVGAAAGAAGGAIVGGVGAVPGAIAVGAGGFIRGVYTALKNDAQKNIVADYKSYQDSLTNIKSIIANAGRDPLDAVQLYQIELAKIDAAERRLKAQTEAEWKDTTKWQLVKIQDFNSYQRAETQRLLLAAIANPKVQQNFEIPAGTETTAGAGE